MLHEKFFYILKQQEYIIRSSKFTVMISQIWFIAVMLTINIKFCWSERAVKRIVDKIFKDYDPKIRPVRNVSQPTTVNINFGIIQLLRVVDVSKTIECICYTDMYWYDDFLKWNPEEFENVTHFRYPQQTVWKPDIILTNTPDLNNGPVMNTAATNVVINYAGMVNVEFTAFYRVTCRNMDMSNFPFDRHRCSLDFASWTYSQDHVDIFDKSYDYELPASMKFVPNEEWEASFADREKLVEWECCPNETYPTLRIYVDLKRKPLFFLINTIIPTMITCYICFFGMFCPSSSSGERTEKAFLGITTLLAVSLLLLNVSNLTPVTSTVVPLMGYFLGNYIITISCGILCTVIIMQIDVYGLNGRPLPQWADKLFIQKLGRWFFVYPFENKIEPPEKGSSYIQRFLKSFNAKEEERNRKLSSTPDLHRTVKDSDIIATVKELMVHMNEILNCRAADKKRLLNIRKQWSQLSVVLDRICLIIFLTWSTVFSFSVLCRSS